MTIEASLATQTEWITVLALPVSEREKGIEQSPVGSAGNEYPLGDPIYEHKLGQPYAFAFCDTYLIFYSQR